MPKPRQPPRKLLFDDFRYHLTSNTVPITHCKEVFIGSPVEAGYDHEAVLVDLFFVIGGTASSSST